MPLFIIRSQTNSFLKRYCKGKGKWGEGKSLEDKQEIKMAGVLASTILQSVSDMARDLILGTAGHIDHGKTSLVKALTGIDCDRLPEEKARGITIDIGFAHLELDGA